MATVPMPGPLAAEENIGHYLATQPTVVNYQIYAGTSSPYNFNGLVRHYFLRREPYQGEIQVNLLPIDERSEQSHPMALAMRRPIKEIGREWNANVKIADVPPDPPVLSTFVGLNLFQSGLTRWCLMEDILQKIGVRSPAKTTAH